MWLMHEWLVRLWFFVLIFSLFHLYRHYHRVLPNESNECQIRLLDHSHSKFPLSSPFSGINNHAHPTSPPKLPYLTLLFPLPSNHNHNYTQQSNNSTTPALLAIQPANHLHTSFPFTTTTTQTHTQEKKRKITHQQT